MTDPQYNREQPNPVVSYLYRTAHLTLPQTPQGAVRTT